MAAPRIIVDGYGKKNALKINGEGEIGVVIHDHPPIDETLTSYPFRQYFTVDGETTGSNDMIVDGSTTPQEFYIAAKEDKDVYIKTISVRLGDTGTVNLSRFGGLAALSVGLDLAFSNNVLGEVTIADEIKTNLELIRVGLASAPVGTGADAFLLDVQGGGTEDTYLPVLDLSQTFGFPWGLRLQKGSKDRLLFRVNDALAGLITFNAIGYGIQI